MVSSIYNLRLKPDGGLLYSCRVDMFTPPTAATRHAQWLAIRA